MRAPPIAGGVAIPHHARVVGEGMQDIERGYGPGDWPVSYSACEDLKEPQ